MVPIIFNKINHIFFLVFTAFVTLTEVAPDSIDAQEPLP